MQPAAFELLQKMDILTDKRLYTVPLELPVEAGVDMEAQVLLDCD